MKLDMEIKQLVLVRNCLQTVSSLFKMPTIFPAFGILYSQHLNSYLNFFEKLSSIRHDRPFAGSGHMVQNKLCWDANNAV